MCSCRARWSVWMASVSAALLLGSLSSSRADSVPGEVLVKFRTAGARQLMAPLRLPAGARVHRTVGRLGWRVVHLAEGQSVAEAVRWFNAQPEVVSAEPNLRYRLLAAGDAVTPRVPNDPLFPRLAGLERIGAPLAWGLSTGTNTVVVAMLDTGVDLTHPDLEGNLWRNQGEIPANEWDDDGNGWDDDYHGYDFADGDSSPSDDAGHGTHVAGIIGAVGNNGVGISGVCWKVSLLPVRVGRSDGFATTDQLVDAFEYLQGLSADAVNVRVVNCSWGSDTPSKALREAIRNTITAGILVVCAAGNDRQDNDLAPVYPASFDLPGIVAVAASTDCDDLASFSNFGGQTVDLAAPGSGILSTYRGGGRYAVLSGTSMAAPYVSGAAALALSIRPKLGVDDLERLLLGTVDVVPAWAGRLRSGGRLNLARVLDSVGSIPDLREPAAPELPLQVVSRQPGPGTRAWGDRSSAEPAVSGDGRWVAFRSSAANLVSGDDGRFEDVFLFDRVERTVVRISETAAGVGGNGGSTHPVISLDGRWVAYVSAANNLVTGDANGVTDVLLWDRDTRRTELVSVRGSGYGSGNGASSGPSISADGTRIAFQSEAQDLVGGDNNTSMDVFVRDHSRGVTERASLSVTGNAGNHDSGSPSISADGNFVAFSSVANNLVANDANKDWDIFVRDLRSGINTPTQRVSVSGDGKTEASDSSDFPVISGDGRFVAFATFADNLDSQAPDGFLTVMLADRKNRTLRRLDRPPGVTAGLGDGYPESISDDGRLVFFTSRDARLAPGGNPNWDRLFVFDQVTGTTVPAVYNAAGFEPDYWTVGGRSSSDGRWLVFAAAASNLVPGDGNSAADVFLLDRGAFRADLAVRGIRTHSTAWVGAGIEHPQVSQRDAVGITARSVGGFEVRLVNSGPSASFILRAAGPFAGGRFTLRAFQTRNGTEVTSDLLGGGWNTGAVPAGSNEVLRVELSVTDSGAVLSEDSFRIEAFADGQAGALDAVIVATATVPEPPSVRVVSRGVTGAPASRHVEGATVSRDGRWVAFSSEANDLEDGVDANDASDIFLWDRETGLVRRQSDASASRQANGPSRWPSLSDDGRRLCFLSRATNLVAGDSNGVEDVFVRHLDSGVLARVSVTATGGQAEGGSDSASISGGGRYVVFTSVATNLVRGDNNQAKDVFVRDLNTAALECVSRTGTGEFGNGDSDAPAITGDGRFVVFQTVASNLVSGDTNAMADIYLWDRTARSMELISATASGRAGNGPSGGAAISDDGRWITFHSYASDLPAGGPFTESTPYLYDRVAKVMQRVDAIVGPLPDRLVVRRAMMSRNGLKLALLATPPCGVANPASQVFCYDWRARRLDRVSYTTTEAPGDDHSLLGRWSGSARYLTIESYAANLAGQAVHGAGQALVGDLLSAGVDALVQREPGAPWRDDGMVTGDERFFLLPTPQAPREGAPLGLLVRNTGTESDSFRVRASPSDAARLIITGIPTGVPGSVPVQLTGAGGWVSPVIEAGSELRLDVRIQFAAVGSSLDRVTVLLQIASESDRLKVDELWVTVVPDVNRNSLPDAWEAAHPLVVNSGRDQDLDRDDLTNYEEWIAGSDPADPRQVSQRVDLVRLGPGRMQLSWRGQEFRAYSVERKRFGVGERFEVAHPSPLVGSDGMMTWQDPEGWPEEGGMYRVLVELP